MKGYGEFGEPLLTLREMANRDLLCGELPLFNMQQGCGARDWRVFGSPLPNARTLVCQRCGGECIAQFWYFLAAHEAEEGPGFELRL